MGSLVILDFFELVKHKLNTILNLRSGVSQIMNYEVHKVLGVLHCLTEYLVFCFVVLQG